MSAAAPPASLPVITRHGDSGRGMTKKERRNWIVALFVAFVLGFLLAWYLLRQHAHQSGCPARSDNGPPVSMSGSGTGHGAPGAGSPVKLGSPDSGTADRTGNSRTTTAEGGGGAQGAGKGGDGALEGGDPWQAHGSDQKFDGKSDARGNAPAGGEDADGDLTGMASGEGKKLPPSQQTPVARPEGPGTLYQENGGKLDTGSPGAAAHPGESVATADTVVAKDLRYDTSELPRYPNAVTSLASGTALPKGAPTPDPNLSVSAIVTTDDPQTVAAWYHTQLPSDWTEMNLGALTVFWPPDRKADPRTVWIVLDDKTKKTAALLWKSKEKPAQGVAP